MSAAHMLAPPRRRRLRAKVQHLIRRSTMLCCGRRKEAREQVAAEMASPRRGAMGRAAARPGAPYPEMVIQGDFRKVSGISTEIFNQIQAVENDHDATTAASLEAVERRGEMMIRLLDLRTMGKQAAEQARRFLSHDPNFVVHFVEIVKRPGQTLGLYIREGNGIDRHDGVFISRVALESAVSNSACLHVGDEILAVNLVDVTNVSLDDVVIIMSIPRRLVLTTQARKHVKGMRPPHMRPMAEQKAPPVVVIKKELEEEPQDESNSNGENGYMSAAHLYGMEAVMMDPRVVDPTMMQHGAYMQEDPYLYYNSQPQMKYRPVVAARPGVGMAVGVREHDPWLVEPSPSGYMRVVSEQPRPLQSYPKTLESLAEKVHSFYAGPRPGPPPPHGPHQPPRLLHPSRSDRALARRGGHPQSGRMLRAESEQRLAAPREVHYEAATLGRPLRSSLKPSPSSIHSGLSDRAAGGYTDAMQRLGALRRRVATESFSDTEAQTMPRASILARQRSLEKAARAHARQLRSNSLPRMRSDDRYRRHRHTVRFEREPLPHDSQEDSDGALSAPELPVRRERVRGIPQSPSVFTSAEYRAWLNRAPSTSAIYEQLKKSREVLHAQRAARVTYSAENLLDRRGEEQPFQYHTYAARPLSQPVRSESMGTGSLSSRRVRYLLDDGRHIPNPTPAKPSEFRVRLVDINPAEFLKYKPEKEPLPTPAHECHEMDTLDAVSGPLGAGLESAPSGFSGMLWVHLLAGRGLKGSGRSEHYRDLYCVLECDHVHKARTVVRTGDQNFDWDETFELDLLNNQQLDFLIYSWDPRFRHKLCYKGSIHLVSVLRESPIHQLALKIEPRGTLYLKIRYTDPRQTFKRLQAQRKNALFGIDLDTVVSREKSNFNVPIIVKRCIEEVERRGLDIIGLYRLCGSATKKRMLRDAFERNPLRVDTSPDNVPDINVITGVLKDYLRELPEPLFTKCLNQMLVDALSVCLPEDPEGNAKLMFSVLDCLPKYNRCTLIMLMDHLKLVVSQSERNKMNAQNLAVVFGPVLLVHTDASSTSVDFHTPVQVLKYLLEIWPSKQESSGSEESNNGQNNHEGQTLQVTEELHQQMTEEQQMMMTTSEDSSAQQQQQQVTWSGQQRVLPESSC